MTYQEIFDALKETGLPVTYEVWDAAEEVPPLPYIVFKYPNNNDFYADNTNYAEIVTLDVRLYTKKKSIAQERAVEAVLKEHFGAYAKTSDYVTADAMQETIYTMEVAINAE
jgi:hypothetical protein